jgi:hypothetical protein
MLSMIEKSNNAATSYQTLALLVERHCSLSYVMNSDNRFGRVGDAHRYTSWLYFTTLYTFARRSYLYNVVVSLIRRCTPYLG